MTHPSDGEMHRGIETDTEKNEIKRWTYTETNTVQCTVYANTEKESK